MDKVFRVELFGEKTNRWCELELPATYYGLLDALDKLQMTLGEKPRWEFLEHHGFVFLQDHLAHECDLYQLNALATCLGQMNGREKTAFEGLFNICRSRVRHPRRCRCSAVLPPVGRCVRLSAADRPSTPPWGNRRGLCRFSREVEADERQAGERPDAPCAPSHSQLPAVRAVSGFWIGRSF